MAPPKKKIKVVHDTAASSAAMPETKAPAKGTAASTKKPKKKQDVTADDITAGSGETTKTAHTACDQVFSTTELLEAVLLDVDNKTLFLIQRVSKTFKATIADSLAIQQKLFLKPSKTMAPVWNTFAFPHVKDIAFRRKGVVLIHEHQPHADLWVSLGYDRKAKTNEPKNLHLRPMLLRQPATYMDVLIGCICGVRNDWGLNEGETFGDLISYLENGWTCDCTPREYDDDEPDSREESESSDGESTWG